MSVLLSWHEKVKSPSPPDEHQFLYLEVVAGLTWPFCRSSSR